jgi:hypothetical protein
MATTYTGATNPFQVTTGSNLNGTVTGRGSWANGVVDVDNIRRKFGIGDYVSQLAPEQSLFFAYLSKVAKKPLDETVWKPLEYRPQWQRRNFQIQVADGAGVAVTETTAVGGKVGFSVTGDLTVRCNYDSTGKVSTTYNQKPVYLLNNQIVRVPVIETTDKIIYHVAAKVSSVGDGTIKLTSVGEALPEKQIGAPAADGAYELVTSDVDNTSSGNASGSGATTLGSAGKSADCQVIGSAFGEATTAPDGWVDKISDAEFYMQIFKTAVPLMSGSAQATRYRGFADEYQRIYAQHVMSHKMDIENAMLFGNGYYSDQDNRYSWGVVPFIELMGGKKFAMTYASSGYDDMVDIMQDFFAPEVGNSGQKLCLTSRKVIAWLSKLGSNSSNSFIYNSLGKDMGPDSNQNTNPYSVSVDTKSSKFAPVPVTSVQTAFGTFNFVAHPLFRGHAENTCAVIDLANVAYRPLVGNGLNRDTFVETNIQDNSVDGRKDQIITECGLEIMLPETHALLTFS